MGWGGFCKTLGVNCFSSGLVVNLFVACRVDRSRGVKRTLGCTCGAGVTDLLCPYHVARQLVQQQMERLGSTEQQWLPLDEFPLICQCGDPKAFVSKSA